MTASGIRAALQCGRPGCLCHRGHTVHCPSHDDRSPSLAVDDAHGRVLVHCFSGCPQRDVLQALRQRGLWHTSPERQVARPWESPLAQARREIVDEAEGEAWARDGVTGYYKACDWIRRTHREVDQLRRVAPDVADPWLALAQAAQLETQLHAVKAEVDTILSEGKLW